MNTLISTDRLPYLIVVYPVYIIHSNMTSFFHFMNKQAIYRLGIISLACAPVYVTDFPIVNVHVNELSSARIWQHKLCATLSAKEYVLSFNMGWRILVFYPEPDAIIMIYFNTLIPYLVVYPCCYCTMLLSHHVNHSDFLLLKNLLHLIWRSSSGKVNILWYFV